MVPCPDPVLLPDSVRELRWPEDGQVWLDAKNRNVLDNREALRECSLQHAILVRWIEALERKTNAEDLVE